MSNEHIKQLLSDLHQELEQAESIDNETLALVQTLDNDINTLLVQESEALESDSIVDQANALEATFATHHPLAERIVREIIDALNRMGI